MFHATDPEREVRVRERMLHLKEKDFELFKIFEDDMLTAAETRLDVFERVLKQNS